MITADALLSNGFALVPIPLGEKGPKHKGWNRLENVVISPNAASRLEGMNIGLAHAYSTPTPTCGIDIDNLQFSRTWLAAHGVMLDPLISAHDAVVIHSGKANSLKLLYRLAEGTGPLVSKKVTDDDGKTALEFRCASKTGLTVQDVLPPSLHPRGSTYRYVGTGDPLNPPYLPAALLNVWHLLAVSSGGKQRCVSGQKKGQRKAVTFVAATPRRVAEVKHALSFVTADCPYEIWRNVVWAVVSTGWDCAEEMAYDWSQTAPERFCEAAFWVVVNSYDPDNVDPITLGTLFHYAKMGRGSWQLS